MLTAEDLTRQKQQLDKQKLENDRLIRDQKDLVRRQIAEYDRELSNLQALRSKAAADLSKLG